MLNNNNNKAMHDRCICDLPGSGGTTILLSRSNSLLSHSKSLYLLLTLESLSLKTGRFVFGERVRFYVTVFVLVRVNISA